MKKRFFKKSLGQNFLVNQSVALKIAGSVEKNQNVLEVGTGEGFLTKFLAEDAKKIVSIEKDDILTEKIFEKNDKNKLLERFSNLEVFHQDVLCFTDDFLQKDFLKNYVLVGNLPYNISKKIIQKFLDGNFAKPREIVVMLQKEVGEQILGKNPSFMTFWTDLFCWKKEKICFVSKNDFFPRPKVDSIVIKLFVRNEKNLRNFLKEVGLKFSQIEIFWKFLKTILLHKRKKIGNVINLQNSEIFEILEKRIEQVDFFDLVKIFIKYENTKILDKS